MYNRGLCEVQITQHQIKRGEQNWGGFKGHGPAKIEQRRTPENRGGHRPVKTYA